MSVSIKFDGTELMNASYTPRFAKHESAPIREIEILNLARETGGILVSEKYNQKMIPIQGILKASSRDDLDTLIDNFKELVSRIDKNLDITVAGATRRYVAYANRIVIDRDHFHNQFVPYAVDFIVPLGVGKDTAQTAALDAVDADPTYTGALTLAGTAKPKVVITMTLGSGWSDAKGIQFKNTDTDEKIITNVSGGLSQADVIEIDTENKTVKLNDAEVEFYGVFPSFQIGTNALEITAGDIVDQQFVFDSDGSEVNSGIHGNNWVAQSFSVSHTDATYRQLKLVLKKTGTPPNNLVVEIQTDSAGKPSGSEVGGATFSLTPASASASFTEETLDSGGEFTLNANTRYWIVLKMTAGDSSNKFEWRGNSGTTANYGRGNMSSSTDGGSNWTDAVTTDMTFKLLYGGKAEAADPNLTLDIDYTKRYL